MEDFLTLPTLLDILFSSLLVRVPGGSLNRPCQGILLPSDFWLEADGKHQQGNGIYYKENEIWYSSSSLSVGLPEVGYILLLKFTGPVRWSLPYSYSLCVPVIILFLCSPRPEDGSCFLSLLVLGCCIVFSKIFVFTGLHLFASLERYPKYKLTCT